MKYIGVNALEEQKRVVVAINREAVKAAFREAMKMGSELHNSAIEAEIVHYPVKQSQIRPHSGNRLHIC